MNRDLLLKPLPAGKLPMWLLKKLLPTSTRDADVLIGPGIGRDAAAIAVGDRVIIVKSDPITFAESGAEEHLVDVNANDIACMGGTPRWMLVTALLPVGVIPADILRDFASLRDACQRRSVELVGGHTEIIPGIVRPILVGMMIGEVEPARLIEPGQARAGDALLLSKGLAIEGTALLARDHADALRERVPEAVIERAARFLDAPGISVLHDARLASDAGDIVALHDPTEGGLATAIREIGIASGVGAIVDIEAIPVYPETEAIASALGLDPLGMLASGALLMAARPEAAPAIVAAGNRAGLPVSVIGHLTDEPGVFTLRAGGEPRPLPEFAVDEVARWLSERA
ncbi:MAG: hydrogenase expression protein [Thermomicrobiales bacterium]|nr:hydrogenase expression protein [Thermomicrobiales bacterium]